MKPMAKQEYIAKYQRVLFAGRRGGGERGARWARTAVRGSMRPPRGLAPRPGGPSHPHTTARAAQCTAYPDARSVPPSPRSRGPAPTRSGRRLKHN